MSIVVQMAGLVVNVKNGIAAVVEIATTLVRNADLNRSQNRKKKSLNHVRIMIIQIDLKISSN
jgi:hypothetical protein